MFLGRFGSLNSLEATRRSSVWRKYMKNALPSADRLGGVVEQIDADGIRRILADLYRKLRKKKALCAPGTEPMALLFDGHESTSSYLRKCPGCLHREVGEGKTKRTQHYHRYVVCSLVGRNFHLFLDAEPLQPNEGEVVGARRLYARIHGMYARAYDVVVADALYMEGPFFKEVIARGKEVIAVLKRKDLNLFKDAEALFSGMEPITFRRDSRDYRCWDISDFTSFETVDRPLRVVKSLESWTRKRQETGEVEELTSQWMWATTLTSEQVGTAGLVALAHSRWKIENQGFNEGSNHYHLDHVYRHEPAALLVFLLLGMLAINLFQTFYRRNTKPDFQRRFSRMDVARMILAVFFIDLDLYSGPD